MPFSERIDAVLQTHRRKVARAHDSYVTLSVYKAPRVRVICLECGRRTSIRIDADSCPYCHSSDLEVA
jgi:Zn finger protein HypA/HybF involved in hydrogenase expression